MRTVLNSASDWSKDDVREPRQQSGRFIVPAIWYGAENVTEGPVRNSGPYGFPSRPAVFVLRAR